MPDVKPNEHTLEIHSGAKDRTLKELGNDPDYKHCILDPASKEYMNGPIKVNRQPAPNEVIRE